MTVSLLLRHTCRAGDFAAPYGGEEFVLVLPETETASSSEMCERARRTVEECFWGKIHPNLSVTVSLGLEAASILVGTDHPTDMSWAA